MLSLPVDMAKTLREMELNLLVAAVDQPHFAIADGGLTLHRLLIDDEDPIVGWIWNHKQVRLQTVLFLHS